MNKYIFVIFIVIFVSSNLIYTQDLTVNEKEEIVAKLDSVDFWTRSGAIQEIRFYKILEAITKLVENIWLERSADIKYAYLECLHILEYQNFSEIAHAFIDSANNFDYEFSPSNPLSLKMMATDLLFEVGDYSTVNYLFESIESDTLNRETVYHVEMLKNLGLNVPENKDYVMAELLRIIDKEEKNNLDNKYAFFALDALQKISGSSMINIAKNLLQDVETKFEIKLLALRSLSNENYYELENLIRERIDNDTSKSFRLALVMKLTEKFPTPYNYNFIQKISVAEDDLRMNNMIFIKLLKFKPTLSDSTISTFTVIDTLTSYTNQCFGYEWLKDEAYKTNLLSKLTTVKNHLNLNDSLNCRTEIASFQNSVNQVYQDSAGSYPKYVSEAGYKFMFHYAQYILDRLPEAPTVEALPVKLQDSQGNLLQEGTLQYYDSGWQDAIDNGNGIFTVQTERITVSLKMLYAGASQQINSVTVGQDTVVFQTVNAMVKLLNSQNTLIDSGMVKYYASGWKDLGTTVNGVATKELLPRQYTFRMEYGGANQDLAQGIDTNATVIFQTTNATVKLLNSQNGLMDEGIVKYYASGWKDLGTTVNGVASKELLPRQYTFRMEYGGTNEDKSQDISLNSVVVFQTVSAEVQLKDSQGNSLDAGVVKYYASGWKDFGVATNGTTSKELLPRQYTFKMEYAGANEDKAQDISSNSVVVYQTVNVEVQLKDSQGNSLDGGVVKYYATGWKDFGTATNGTTSKELLGRTYTFRMTHEKVSNDKSQDVSVNNAVSFATILTTVQVKDAQNQPIENAEVLYYSAGWNQIGFTVNGEITKELLPKNITFRAKQGTTTQDKQQDTAINNIVEIILE